MRLLACSWAAIRKKTTYFSHSWGLTNMAAPYNCLFKRPKDCDQLEENKAELKAGDGDGRLGLFAPLFLLNVHPKGSYSDFDQMEVLGWRGCESILTSRRLASDEACGKKGTHSISTTSLSSWIALGVLP
jgi:hypothetical protein